MSFVDLPCSSCQVFFAPSICFRFAMQVSLGDSLHPRRNRARTWGRTMSAPARSRRMQMAATRVVSFTLNVTRFSSTHARETAQSRGGSADRLFVTFGLGHLGL